MSPSMILINPSENNFSELSEQNLITEEQPTQAPPVKLNPALLTRNVFLTLNIKTEPPLPSHVKRRSNSSEQVQISSVNRSSAEDMPLDTFTKELE
ncbi:hypothetical protein CEXT_404111 [Caerostris extrusa]|uniref:Uncharacterized protein n=1 Tax=Caerostris extrusa TaxID=172846 RepID=A0AAV4NJ04_CAEEX|nr:hypothetical protein CEXT_404111 [Caerostris extrusa]